MIPEVLERHISRVPWSGCWLWTGALSRGYGQVTFNKRHLYAHRLIWELATKEAPRDLQLCHRCDTPSCVRPDHMFLGTQKQNVRDAISKGRFKSGVSLGENNGFAKITAAGVLEIRRRFNAGESARRIAPDFGISKSQAWNIATMKSWRHVNGV